MDVLRRLFIILPIVLLQSCTSGNPESSNGCLSLDCETLKYSLLVADIDGSDVSVVRTSAFQEMTHPRVSNDKQWVAYTAYNQVGSDGCASLSVGYQNTEIRAVKISGTDDKRIIAPVSNSFNSNNYFIGNTNEFTYLSGPAASLQFYRAAVDTNMNLIGTPVLIPQWTGTPATFVPFDPQSNPNINRVVYPALYIDSGTLRKSLFLMNLSNSLLPVALTLGRDQAGTLITCSNSECENIMENDPKISADGTKVAFMRRASASGTNGFGWNLFVVNIASPLSETNISWTHHGSNLFKNDVLPEWLDSDTLIFSTIEIISSTNIIKDVYTMNIDGTQRSKINLPSGFRYSDVIPFTDTSGRSRIVVSAEKIGASCSQ